MDNNRKRADILWDICFVIALAAAFFFLLWKCRYGYGQYDEAFYLDFTYRFVQGDKYFIHEWHPAQMFSFILLPLMKLYLSFIPSTDGIMLNWRFITIIIQTGIAIFLYYRLRKFSRTGGMVSALFFLIYIPFGITALSYNSLGIFLLVLSGVLLCTSEKQRYVQWTISGICFAGAVLCCPYLVLLYIGLLLNVVMLLLIRKKGIANPDSKDVLINFVMFSIGAAFLAVLFFGYLLSMSDVSEYFKAISIILTEPGHSQLKGFRIIWNYFSSIVLHSSEYKAITAAIYPLLFFICLWVGFDKNKRRREICFVGFSGFTFILELLYFMVDREINFIIYPIALYGLFLYVFFNDHRMDDIFYHLWIPGMIYSFCINLSSNVHFYAISSASMVAAAGSIIMCGMVIETDVGNGYIACKNIVSAKKKILVIGVVMTALGLLLLLRYTTLFWEGKMNEQTYRLSEGPQSGIYVSEERCDLYNELFSETAGIRNDKFIKNVFYDSGYTWLYLMTEQRNSGYSSCLSFGTEDKAVFKKYYDMNPDKIPDAIYVGKENGRIANWFCNEYGYGRRIKKKYGEILLK